jgi:hypothetical protein
MTRRHVSRLAAAVLVTAAAGLTLLGTSAPAGAATCSTSSGVTVIVDFKQLGGGVQGDCVAGGGGQRASALFPTAGFSLTYVQNQPGFVCRVSGLPTASAEPCVTTPPITAYWGLWWSDGKTGTWTYSSYGVSSLKIPDGGYVALAWKQGDAPASAPGVAPAAHSSATPTPTPSPSPTKSPSASPTKSPTSNPTKTPTTSPTTSAPSSPPSADATATETPTESVAESPSENPTESESPTDSASPIPTATDSTSGPVVQDPADPLDASTSSDSDGGVPIVLVLVLIVALFGGSAAAVVVRRRRA